MEWEPEDWDDEEDGENGQPQPFLTQSTKDHGSKKKINNPDYKGKWKAPLIDNPDIFTFNFEQRQFHLRLTLLSISTFMLILKVHMHLFIDVCRIQGRCLHLCF
ncbi:unnamed protein product [Miscanthus lutarioriparius]|uniref:Calreticulin n=1 Tax=Miscanthus lutarioriparius TaxID=422564 RepID=A0A811MDM2_9POAL|nr:unnamed protein product [Miscanthus lutarioriparius]